MTKVLPARLKGLRLMRRARVFTLLVAIVAATTALDAQKPSDKDRVADGELVSLRGCVSGSLLRAVVANPGVVIDASDRYRMIGSKELKAKIKAANKALVQVTGRVKPGPQSVAKGTKVGGTSIGIGVTPRAGSMETQAPYTPTIEVEEIVVIAKIC
jgi:hypothetical protein